MTFEDLTATLERLGVHPVTVGTPFPQAGRHVHFYVVDDSRPALIDTGLYSAANERYVEQALNKLGYALGDIKRVFLTHGHIDHYGNALHFQQRGAEVFIHPADATKVTGIADEGERAHLKSLYEAEFVKHGFPLSLVEHLERIFLNGNDFARGIAAPTRVADGDRFQFDRFALRAFTVPGHTPGCVSYFFGDSGVAVTGDHLLEDITPNPLFELNAAGEQFPSLVTYFESLRKILDHGVRLGLPAHGPFITDAPALVASMTAFYTRRQGKLFKMLAEPADAFTLCQTYYRRLKGLETFLGFSEILGNLAMMAKRGEIALESEGGRHLYRRVAPEPLPLWEGEVGLASASLPGVH